jgi:hypothetical protein
MEDGRWKMEDGRWKMEDGRWKMEDGRWIPVFAVITIKCVCERLKMGSCFAGMTNERVSKRGKSEQMNNVRP